VGEYDVVLDGYSQVWEFIDELIPNTYRKTVNHAMKGDLKVNFKEVLANFLEESDAMKLIFSYEKSDVFEIPNDYHTIADAYVQTGCKRAAYEQMPLRDKSKIVLTDCVIIESHPIYTVVHLSQSLLSHVVSSFIVGEEVDYRPFPMERFVEREDAIRRAYERMGHLVEGKWVEPSKRSGNNKRGMNFHERDYYEYCNYLEAL